MPQRIGGSRLTAIGTSQLSKRASSTATAGLGIKVNNQLIDLTAVNGLEIPSDVRITTSNTPRPAVGLRRADDSRDTQAVFDRSSDRGESGEGCARDTAVGIGGGTGWGEMRGNRSCRKLRLRQ